IETNPAGTSSATSPATAVVVDTTTPAAPVLTSATDAVGPVQGVIPANGFTDDSHPTIAGTGKAGDIITILNNGVAIGSTTADVNGKWSFKPTAALPEGATVLTATDTNKAGTTSAASAALSFTVDTLSGALPVITGATDNVGPVKGEVLSGGTTDDPKCVIHGTGHVGDIIKVYDGSTAYFWGSAVVVANGTWSMTPTSALNDNTHKLFAIATAGDGTGAVSAQTPFFLLTVNTTTPATPAAPTLTDDNGNAIPAGSTT
ncbi:Ig-like domain-containing protein, partial [Caballeronia sp. dw_19]|uniref:Ig-like domain-containing protein n=1 Tax=Caballeronia sp. dw_19 TaxID=2719791 RepID=UPI001BD54753